MNRLLVAVSLTVLSATLAQAAPAAKPVATVNGKAIPATRADAMVKGQIAQGRKDDEELRKAVKEELVRREVIAQEAAKKGVDKKPEVQAQVALASQGVVIGAYLNDYVATHPISDESVKAEYDNIRKALGEKEYKVRHILVETEGEAKDIIEKLKKGQSFEELAKASKDPGSKERGGDLGWANQAAYVKPFSDAMLKLEKGKFTEAPVKSNFGWHVIQLDDTRDLKAPGLDEVKPQLVQRLQQQMVEKHVMDLRNKAKVD